MRRLYLVRHAKSSWDDPALPDRERPLNERGKRDAPRMGKHLAKDDVAPDLIIASPARRALTTARIIAAKLDYDPGRIRVDDRLYAVDVDVLLQVIRELGDGKKCVMLVGHNPEFTDLAHLLSREIGYLPTCAVAEFAFDAESWTKALRERPARALLHTPAQI